jgi:hypothetical protein
MLQTENGVLGQRSCSDVQRSWRCRGAQAAPRRSGGARRDARTMTFRREVAHRRRRGDRAAQHGWRVDNEPVLAQAPWRSNAALKPIKRGATQRRGAQCRQSRIVQIRGDSALCTADFVRTNFVAKVRPTHRAHPLHKSHCTSRL